MKNSKTLNSARITQLTPWVVSKSTNLLAVSDSVGTLHILEIPWNYRHPTLNEANTMKAYISREVSRIQFFQDRKTAGTGPEEKTITEQDLTEIVTDEDLEKDFKEYLQLEAQLVVKLNI